jgi:hypothetical protein
MMSRLVRDHRPRNPKDHGLPRGVYRRIGKRKTSYQSQITHRGRNYGLGTFDTPEEAIQVLAIARQQIQDEKFCCGGCIEREYPHLFKRRRCPSGAR